MNKRFFSFVFSLLVFTTQVIHPALLFDTPVLTQNGTTPVQDVAMSTVLESWHEQKNSPTQVSPVQFTRKELTAFVQITLEQETIKVCPEQLIFDLTENKFIPARNLSTTSVFITRDGEQIPCIKAELIEEKATAYTLSLESPHTLFAGESQILAHNIAVVIGAAWAFGEGACVLESVYWGLATAGIVATLLKGRGGRVQAKFDIDPVAIQAPMPSDPPPKKPDEKDNKSRKEKDGEKKEIPNDPELPDLAREREERIKRHIKNKEKDLSEAQEKYEKKIVLEDGRERYYSTESPSSTPGPTRGRKAVVEHDPKTGDVRKWMECYDHNGNVNRVHPKRINGRKVDLPHYPPTAKDFADFPYLKDLLGQ